jgi:hypothetical protein
LLYLVPAGTIAIIVPAFLRKELKDVFVNYSATLEVEKAENVEASSTETEAVEMNKKEKNKQE